MTSEEAELLRQRIAQRDAVKDADRAAYRAILARYLKLDAAGRRVVEAYMAGDTGELCEAIGALESLVGPQQG